MLEQTKVVLSNVSFDFSLFRKELLKAIKWLNSTEIETLKQWCFENFSEKYKEIASEILIPQASY
jgi:replication initiation and membrane attachment protein DnaB